MFRTDILKKYKYTKKYKHAEDYDLWFKIAHKHKLANIPEFLTYRVHDTNISRQNSNEQKENAGDLISAELDRLGINHTPQELAISIAMVFGFGKRYFNTLEKIGAAEKWVSKVFSFLKSRHQYSDAFIQSMQRYLSEFYCDRHNNHSSTALKIYNS